MTHPLAAVLVAVSLALGAAPSAAATDDLVVTGYAMEGSATRASVTRDGGLLDTIAIAGVSLTARGGITPISRDVAALRRAAADAGRHAVLLVSNYSSAIDDFDEARAYRVLGNPRLRAAVVRTLVQRSAGFAGVQLDLESLRPRDSKGLVALTRALQSALPARKQVSMAFMASTDARGYAARGYDLTALRRSLDVAVLMGYDQHGPWSNPGPIGALTWLRPQLRYFLTRMPASKVDLGVAAYGYRWGGGSPELTVAQARRLAGSRAVWSPTYGEWHASLGQGRVLWWDDARSVGLRRQLAQAEGLHGLAIWQIGSSGSLSP